VLTKGKHRGVAHLVGSTETANSKNSGGATTTDTVEHSSGRAIPNISSIIEKTIKSINRKKLNLIVSGIAETGSEKDD